MSKFIYFTPEEKAQAQNTDLVSLLSTQGGTVCALRPEVLRIQRSRHHRMGEANDRITPCDSTVSEDTTPPMDASVSISSQQSGQTK